MARKTEAAPAAEHIEESLDAGWDAGYSACVECVMGLDFKSMFEQGARAFSASLADALAAIPRNQRKASFAKGWKACARHAAITSPRFYLANRKTPETIRMYLLLGASRHG